MLIYNNWQSYDYAHRMPVKVRCYSQHCIIYFSQHCSVSPQSHNKLMGPLWMNMQCLEKTTHSLRTHETGTSSHESQAEATGTLRRCHRLAAGMNEICLFHNDSQAWPGLAFTILIWKYISHPEYIFWSTLSGQAQLAFTASGIPFTNFKRNL